MQFVYLPTGDYVSGYIRDLQSVGISVHDYDLWTEETRPIAERTLEHIRQEETRPIAERTLEHIRQSMNV